MAELIVDNLQGLNEVPEASPEGIVQPNEAVIAENVDPFRGPNGTVVPTMKFDRITLERGAGIPDEAKVTGTIKFADHVLLSLAEEDDEGKLINPVLGYIDGQTILKLPLNTDIGVEYDMIPKRWVVDPHVYEWTTDRWDTIKYYNLYLYGWRPEKVGGERYNPTRIVYSVNEGGDGVWVYIPMNMKKVEITSDYFSYLSGGHIGGDFTGWYLYLFILRDPAGNLFIHSDGYNNPYEKFTCDPAQGNLEIYITFRAAAFELQAMGITSVDIYRRKVAETTTYVDWTRYVGTFDTSSRGRYFTDTEPDDTKLGDLPEYDVTQLPDLCYNIDKAEDGVVGLWQNRLAFSVKNEIMWSDLALNTAYGCRFLNFPSINMWSFPDIGTITDLLEQRDNLVALSTSGIANLHGSTLANMYSEKVDDASSVFFPNLHNDYGQWWWTAVNFDDWIIFIDSAGRPRIFDGRDAKPLGDKVVIPLLEEVEGKMVPNNLDAVRYRNGYILTTGDKIYAWCRDGDRWATWTKEPFARFLRPNEPWLNEEFVVDEPPAGFEGRGGLLGPDQYYGSVSPPRVPNVFGTRNRTYLYLFDEEGNLYSYGSREDEYPVDMTWRTPRIPLKGENYYKLLKLKWSYLPYSGYNRSNGSTPEEPVELVVTPWLDDEEEPNESRSKTISLVDEVKPGTYQCLIPLSVRANRLGYDLQVLHGRHFALNGYELMYDPKGRRTYGR